MKHEYFRVEQLFGIASEVLIDIIRDDKRKVFEKLSAQYVFDSCKNYDGSIDDFDFTF